VPNAPDPLISNEAGIASSDIAEISPELRDGVDRA
jgi:hypothetical protein